MKYTEYRRKLLTIFKQKGVLECAELRELEKLEREKVRKDFEAEHGKEPDN